MLACLDERVVDIDDHSLSVRAWLALNVSVVQVGEDNAALSLRELGDIWIANLEVERASWQHPSECNRLRARREPE